LIEAIQGNFKHGAINYKLSSLGLVYLFSEGIMLMDLAEVMAKYPQNTLFQVCIYKSFERVTLQHCTDTLESFLINYIEECCQKIRSIFNLNLKHSYTSEILSNTLNLQFEWQTRSFFLNLVTIRDELIIDWLRNGDDDKNENLSLRYKDKKS
jgi:hypothetical protein